MKTRNLLITLSVAVLATINVMAADALLSPRAKDNQPAQATQKTAPPRVLDNQTMTVAGMSDEVTPSSQCTRRMSGTPKEVGACADHPGAPMSCCSVAGEKK